LAAAFGAFANSPERGGCGLSIFADGVADEPVRACKLKLLAMMLACAAKARRHSAADGIRMLWRQPGQTADSPAMRLRAETRCQQEPQRK